MRCCLYISSSTTTSSCCRTLFQSFEMFEERPEALCMQMCPQSEIRFRNRNGLVHILETDTPLTKTGPLQVFIYSFHFVSLRESENPILKNLCRKFMIGTIFFSLKLPLNARKPLFLWRDIFDLSFDVVIHFVLDDFFLCSKTVINAPLFSSPFLFDTLAYRSCKLFRMLVAHLANTGNLCCLIGHLWPLAGKCYGTILKLS